MMKKSRVLMILVLTLLLILSACATPTDQPQPQVPSEETTLVVWDQFYRDEESKVIEILNSEFEAAHPGVKIERETKVLADLQMTVKLALGETDGPDVAQVNQGRSDMGALVEAGLLLPLDDYVAQYNWGNVFSSSVASRNSFTTDGSTFGQGSLFGVSPTAEVVGVFFNKGILPITTGRFRPPSKILSSSWLISKLPISLRSPLVLWTAGMLSTNIALFSTCW
ncbi:MAG: extracellular solute-binding protein [Chloroflexi bacterium]|nr:extracellular solute-binding protein [Chloroflexota bacterium]